MEEQRTIDEWSRHFRFTNRGTDRVHSIIQSHGVIVATHIFEQMEEGALIGKENRIQQFQRISEDVIREHNRQRKTREFDERYEGNQAESSKAHQKGYTPDAATLRSQLDAMYDKGEISTQEYEWGIKGLQTVYGLIEAAQQIPEEELTAAPF